MIWLNFDEQVDNLLAVADDTLPAEKQSYFTKKIIAELREVRGTGKSVAQHDLNQLQHYYAEDLMAFQRRGHLL